jgi:hypothetical protein
MLLTIYLFLIINTVLNHKLSRPWVLWLNVLHLLLLLSWIKQDREKIRSTYMWLRPCHSSGSWMLKSYHGDSGSFQVTSSEIHGGHSGIGIDFSSEFFGFPLLITIASYPSITAPWDLYYPWPVAHYHTYSSKLGTSSLNWHCSGSRGSLVFYMK